MTNSKRLPSLPGLPSIKQLSNCACGCDRMTQSRFAPGHDSKLYGRIKRVKAGVFDPTQADNVTAQLDASMKWLTPSEVSAVAEAIGATWTLEAANKRADAAAKAAKAS